MSFSTIAVSRAATDDTPRQSRVPSLDGLRGLACLLVVFAHYGQSLTLPMLTHIRPTSILPFFFAVTGVDLFFVLSGFLLGGICIDHRSSSNYYVTFYARRFCRIFPLYYLWLSLTILFEVAGHGEASRQLFHGAFPWWSYITYLQNFVMALRGNFGPHSLLVSWSLAIEEQFYLFLPFLIRVVPVRRLPGVLIALVFAGIGCRAAIFYTVLGARFPDRVFAMYVLTPARMDGLFLGILTAWAVRHTGLRSRFENSRSLLWLLTGAVGATCVYFGFAMPSHQATCIPFTVFSSGFYAGLLLLALYSPLVARLLRFRPLVFLGTISYGVYLLHVGILRVVGKLLSSHLTSSNPVHGMAAISIAMIVTTGIAWLSYRYFESPILKLGRRFKYQSVGGKDSSAAPPKPRGVSDHESFAGAI